MNKLNLEKLAVQFMRKAIKVEADDNVMIAYRGSEAYELAEACSTEVEAAGGHPFFDDMSGATLTKKITPMSPEEIDTLGQTKLERMKSMQGYILIKDDNDQAKLRLPADVLKRYNLAVRPGLDYILNHARWLVVAAPTKGFAKASNMTLPRFEDFYLGACLVDYAWMTKAAAPLLKIMTETKQVRILSPAQETDLTFALNGLKALPCTGRTNIPDGECYTAPALDSINGTIKFGPSNRDGQSFRFIKLTFKDGQIVKAEAENSERAKALNKILDIDPGARRIGEFALGLNPYINDPTGRSLFDEKINGSLHLAAGNSYTQTDNGNHSALHWDMVHIQRPEFGGGDIYFDNQLIRKDGRFVVPELEGLNPENLMASTTRNFLNIAPRKRAGMPSQPSP